MAFMDRGGGVDDLFIPFALPHMFYDSIFCWQRKGIWQDANRIWRVWEVGHSLCALVLL